MFLRQHVRPVGGNVTGRQNISLTHPRAHTYTLHVYIHLSFRILFPSKTPKCLRISTSHTSTSTL